MRSLVFLGFLTGCLSVLLGQELRVGVLPSAAVDEGLVLRGEPLTLVITSAIPDEAGLARAVAELYDPSSPRYRHWMTDEELARFAPSPVSVRRVQGALERQGLRVVDRDANGFSLVVQGPVEAAERAFAVSVHQFSRGPERFREAVGEPTLRDGAQQFVAAVAGFADGSHSMRPALRRVYSEAAGKAVTPAAAPVTFPFTQSCFSLQPQTFVYSPALPASVPVASYFGSVYGTQSQPCGLSPEYVAGHYAKGGGGNHYGSGQTMVVTAAYGYPFTVRDANFLEEGASALTAKNYREAAPFGRPADPLAGTKLGWDHQIAQAVQWAHGFAGESNLVLLLAKDDKPASFLALENYIVTHHLGHVVSNTWSGGPERSFSGADLAAWNRVLQLGAAQGIDFLFPSGDDGDNGVGSALGAPNFPASSPYVTAVGGTSLIKRPDGNYNEVGWGTYRTDVAAGGPLAAPVQRGFQGGSGGGESAVFPKPAWQAGLLGTGRQVPDIAAFADPYMGAVYALTVNGQYTLQVTGGTGVAVSILTGLLTQADDAADHPLGQAAPRIARMNTAGMQDLTAVSGPANVQGAVFTDGNQVVYPARALFSNAPEFPLSFWSAIWPYANGSASVLSFGTDTSLQVGPGWDNVTGWGVPAAGFVEEVSK